MYVYILNCIIETIYKLKNKYAFAKAYLFFGVFKTLYVQKNIEIIQNFI